MRWYLPDGNPLLWNELRRLLRGGRMYLFFLIEVLVLAGVLVISAGILPAQHDAHAWSAWGEQLFLTIMGWQLGLVILFSPLLCAAAVSGEWERNSMEALWLSPVSTRSLVAGKLLGTVGYLGLMLLAGMPVLGLVAILGGIPLWWLLLGYLLTLSVGAFSAAWGLLASCNCTRTSHAVLLAYVNLGIVLACSPTLAVPVMFVYWVSDNIVTALPVSSIVFTLMMAIGTYAVVLSCANSLNIKFDHLRLQ